MKQARNPYHFLVFLLAVFILEAILFSVGDFKINQEIKFEEERIEKIQTTLFNAPILAKAISVYDITSDKKIFGKDDDIPMPIASLAKIMTVVIGLNGHDMDEVVAIPPDAVSQEGDFGIYENEKWKIDDVAKFTLLVSANDGAYVFSLGQDEFLDRMNEKAKRLGAKNTLFLNSTGLDVDMNTVGAVATAEDVNIMAMYAHLARPEIFEVTTLPEINLKSESGFLHYFKNTNPITEKIPNLLLSKTGYTELAGGNLVIIFQDRRGHKIAVTILGSTFEGRFPDMEKIVEVLYNE